MGNQCKNGLKWHRLYIRISVVILMAFLLITCIDPFNISVKSYESVLVIDALITDENRSNLVTISKTKQDAYDECEMVTGATVKIEDDLGNITTLAETDTGYYRTDSLEFRGEAGRTYTLYVRTAEGKEYKSDECMMYPAGEIESISYTKGQEIISNLAHDGIKIIANSMPAAGSNYYRWTYEEWWEIHVPYPKLYDYINSDSIVEISPSLETCWSHNKSGDIVIKSAETVFSQPVLFVASDLSPRLLDRYCVEIKQLSVSEEEYEFWNKMNQIDESGGDIFDKQPFQISGNIHCVDSPDEQVLGYFQVSGADVERVYIDNEDLSEMDLPAYEYDCYLIEIGPSDYPIDPRGNPPPTFDEIYDDYVNQYNYVFIYPVCNDMEVLERLAFVTPVCGDCTREGSLEKPYFWSDSD